MNGINRAFIGTDAAPLAVLIVNDGMGVSGYGCIRAINPASPTFDAFIEIQDGSKDPPGTSFTHGTSDWA